ncbi:MAG: heme exporter protein CcmB [Actinomycetota bacterium]|nr:heme exporter protein CcmB [Actinomycetota bacterium]
MSARAQAGFLSKSWALARKDLRIEYRARETLLPMIAFAFAVTLLLSFALPGEADLQAPVRVPPIGTVPMPDVLSGFLWVTVLFAGLIGFARTFEAERDEGAIDSILLLPLDRTGVWLGKALANLSFIVAIELFVIPLFALLFGFRLGSSWAVLVGVVALVDVGFVAVGTLFASVAAQTRSRELILPILALPALVPLFIAAVELCAQIFVGRTVATVAGSGWFGILVASDVIFIAVCALAFEFVID